MTSFKVANNKKHYKGGLAEDFVRKGCYSIAIAGSSKRLKQMEKVQIGDIFYMTNCDRTGYWKGIVTSGFEQVPRPSNGETGLNTVFSFWYDVQGKRDDPDDVPTWEGTDERICKVEWGTKTELGQDLKERLNKGYIAVTINELSSDMFPPV